MRDNEETTELSRRQFFQLSGVIGGSAILTGAGLKLDAAHPLGRPDPSTCGRPSDTDHLWQAVQHCNSGVPGCAAKQKNNNGYVFAGNNSHNFITVPTERVNGIECPWICDASAPNYWQDAWKWAHTSPTKVSAEVGLGINSKANRMAQQLHIHMAQVRKQSLADLSKQDGDAATNPNGRSKSRASITGYSATSMQFIPHVYRVLKLGTFGSTNLFARLRDMVGQQKMEYQTLIVIPRPLQGGGYYIVNSERDLKDPARPHLLGSDTCDPLLQLA